MRGETIGGSDAAAIIGLFQSTPLMRGETGDKALYEQRIKISIHSPHARGDTTV